MCKRQLSILLCLCMVISLLPTVALATNATISGNAITMASADETDYNVNFEVNP